MAYVYRHIRLDKNEPFYIGIGSDLKYNRAYSTYDRNKYWRNIANKYEYRVEILLDDLTWEKACNKEIEFINLYGRFNINSGPLVNMTSGGEGANGVIISDETRIKYSNVKLGKNNPNSKKVINTSTGKIYSSIREAADDIGINKYSLSKMLLGKRNNKTDMVYM